MSQLETDYTRLEEYLTTNTLTNTFILSEHLFKLQIPSFKQLDSINVLSQINPLKYLLLLSCYSIVEVDCVVLEDSVKHELVSSMQAPLLQLFQNQFLKLYDELNECVEQYEDYRKTPRSYLKFLMSESYLLSQPPQHVQPLCSSWISWNLSLKMRREAIDRDHKTLVLASAMNSEVAKEYEKSVELRDPLSIPENNSTQPQTYQQGNTEYTSQTIQATDNANELELERMVAELEEHDTMFGDIQAPQGLIHNG